MSASSRATRGLQSSWRTLLTLVGVGLLAACSSDTSDAPTGQTIPPAGGTGGSGGSGQTAGTSSGGQAGGESSGAGGAAAGAGGAAAGSGGATAGAGGATAGGAGSPGGAGQGGQGAKGPSQPCMQSGECSSGLTCLPLATFQAGMCTSDTKICSKACDQQDASACKEFGQNFKCFGGCDGASFCAASAAPGGKKDASEVCMADDECVEGLQCLPFKSEPDTSTCSPSPRVCTRPCMQGMPDPCVDLGAAFKCLGVCEGKSVCFKTG